MKNSLLAACLMAATLTLALASPAGAEMRTAGRTPTAVAAPAPAAPAPAGPAAKINTTVSSTQEGADVYWTFDKTQEAAIDGFILERQDTGAKTFKAVSSKLPAAAREYKDVSAKGKKGRVTYRIVTLAPGGGRRESIGFEIDMQPAHIPLPPTGVTAKVVAEGEKRFIELKWNPKAGNDPYTVSYQYFSDQSKAGDFQPSSDKPVKGTTLRQEVFAYHDEEFEAGVAGVSDEGHYGPQTTVKVTVPGRSMPEPFDFKGRVNHEGRVTLTWDIKPVMSSLAGFRIYRGKTQVADEKTVGATERQWTLPDPLAESRDPEEFNIEAVSKYGAVSFRIQLWVSPVRGPKPTTAP